MHSPHDYDTIVLPLTDSALRQSACKTYLVQRELCVCCRCVACRTCVTVCRSWRPNCVVTWTRLFPPRVGGCPSSFVSAFSACPCSLSISLSPPSPPPLLPLSLCPPHHSLSLHPQSPPTVCLCVSPSPPFSSPLSPTCLSRSLSLSLSSTISPLSVCLLCHCSFSLSFSIFLYDVSSSLFLSSPPPPPTPLLRPPSLHPFTSPFPSSSVSPFLSHFHLPLIPLHLPFVCPPPPPPPPPRPPLYVSFQSAALCCHWRNLDFIQNGARTVELEEELVHV